jgi:hypothetical protein
MGSDMEDRLSAHECKALKMLGADSDEAGHAFQFEAGRGFRFEAGHPGVVRMGL